MPLKDFSLSHLRKRSSSQTLLLLHYTVSRVSLRFRKKRFEEGILHNCFNFSYPQAQNVSERGWELQGLQGSLFFMVFPSSAKHHSLPMRRLSFDPTPSIDKCDWSPWIARSWDRHSRRKILLWLTLVPTNQLETNR